MAIDGYDSKTISYHVYLLSDADFLNVSRIPPTFEDHFFYVPNTLTWAGHEFLEAARDNGKWEQVQQVGSKVGGLTLDVMKAVLIGLAKEQIRGLGIPVI